MSRALAAAIVVASCGPTASPPVAAPPPAVEPDRGPSLADPLALLPADADIIVTVDVAALRKSPLFAAHRAMLRDFILPGFAGCDYDPFDELATFTLGVPLDRKLGVFVARGLDRDATLRCLRTSQVETPTVPVFDDDVVFLRNKSGHTNAMTFVSAKDAVIQGSNNPTKETLAAALRAGAPLRRDRDLAAAMQALPRGAALTVLTRPRSVAAGAILAERLGAPVRGMVLTVHASRTITAHIAIELLEAALAGAVVDHVRPQLDGLRQVVERYDIRAEGAVVLVDIEITEAQIQAIAAMAKAVP
jgi:hypothetical protein